MQQYLERGFCCYLHLFLQSIIFNLIYPKNTSRCYRVRIITMAIDCYHFLLCTNTKSRDCTIIVRCLYNPTEEKSSIHLCPLLICSECTIKRLFPTLIFKSYLSPEKPSATLPHPSLQHQTMT